MGAREFGPAQTFLYSGFNSGSRSRSSDEGGVVVKHEEIHGAVSCLVHSCHCTGTAKCFACALVKAVCFLCAAVICSPCSEFRNSTWVLCVILREQPTSTASGC